MNRRDTLFGLLALGAAPLAIQAQPAAKPARIAYLQLGGSSERDILVEAFKKGLRDLGYIEGKDFVFEARWALGKAERLPDLAKELVALKPDVIVTTNSTAARAAQQVTTTIPIVIATVSDPVGMGLVKSLARPGGNITGLSSLASEYSPKLLELLLTVVPKLSRLAILYTSSAGSAQLENLQAAAQRASVNVLMMEVQAPADIEDAFTRMALENIRGVIVVATSLFFTQRRQIVELAAKHRIPSVFMSSDYPEVGGLMSYGPNYADACRREATYVDKILRGAKPADLPIEQATTFELVVNLKTAKALGITIPQSILLRADKVIE
jgi:putative ABC transport system substrate-binding protein